MSTFSNSADTLRTLARQPSEAAAERAQSKLRVAGAGYVGGDCDDAEASSSCAVAVTTSGRKMVERSLAVQALSPEGEQLRYRGPTPDAYKAPLKELKLWASAHEPSSLALVTALTHHGWERGGLMPCRETSSPTCKNATKAVASGELPAHCFAFGEPTGPQIVSCLMLLKEAHAPAAALNQLWSCYSGSVAEPVDFSASPVDVVAGSDDFDDEAQRHQSSLLGVADAQPRVSAGPVAGVTASLRVSSQPGDGPRVELVPPEASNVVEYRTTPAAGDSARRLESVLVKEFEQWLVMQGHDVQRAQIRPIGEAAPLVTDTYDVTSDVLYEAKSKSDRATIRLGVGQLLDYLRFLPAKGSLLLPSNPSDDLRSFIFSCGLSVTFPQDSSWVTDEA